MNTKPVSAIQRLIIAGALAASLALCLLAATSCATFPRAGVDRVRDIDLCPEGLPHELDGYRIAFITDTHYGNNFPRERLERLVASVNEERPDCILLGGDYTNTAAETEEFAEVIGSLSAPGGVYAVSGNHDFYESPGKLCAALRKRGIVVLDETVARVPGNVEIAGINNFRDIYPDMARFEDIRKNSAFSVLVSHNPDFAEETDISGFDLMLSGHTHGGQITLFGYAPVIPSAYGQKYRTGTILKDGVPVIVSNGAGYSGVRLLFRFCAPSDFLLITLRASAPTKGR